MVKTAKRNRGAAVLLSCFMLMFGIVCSMPNATKANAFDFHGIELLEDATIKTYYMKLSLTSLTTKKIRISYAPAQIITGLCSQDSRVIKEVSFIFTFNNLLYSDETNSAPRPIAIMANIKGVSLPPINGFKELFNKNWQSIVFTEDKVIGLTNNYYKWITQKSSKDFSNVTVSIGYNGNWASLGFDEGVPFVNLDWTVNIHNVVFGETDVPADHFDPDSPNFDIDEGNTGDNTVPPPQEGDVVSNNDSILDKFLEWLAGLLGISVADLKTLGLIILIGLAALILLPFIVKLLKSFMSVFD
jgi:hypothetical protein